MENEMNGSLELLEQELGGKLRDLPEVRPNPEFSQRLWEEMKNSKPGSPGKGKRTVELGKLLQLPRMGMVAAALLIVLAGGWLGGVWTQQEQMAGIGTLLVPCAQAMPGETADLSFRLGLQNTLSKLEFKLQASFPNLPSELTAERLVRPDLTVADIEALAKRMGIEGATHAEPGSRRVYVGDLSVGLTYDLDSGTFFYETRGESSGVPAALSAAQAEAAALTWIRKAGLLLNEPYAIDARQDGLCYWVTIRQEVGPDNKPIVSYMPSYRVLVVPGEQIAAADGGWYASEGSMLLPITTFKEAFAALTRGEGEFVAQVAPYSAGEVVVTGVEVGYQLAYALDYTPYLVPVAVFEGQVTPEGRDTVPFMAYVSLVKRSNKQNAGNYILATSMPEVQPKYPVLTERELAVSESEIPSLLSFFGMAEAKQDENNTYRTDDAELGSTSWDGGWLWRGIWKSENVVSGTITAEQATSIARELAEALPTLPGEPAEPHVSGGPQDGYYWVQFGLRYTGLEVNSLGAPSGSYLAVQVDVKTGEVTTVNCAKPMQLGQSMQAVISPEQAWEKLLDNEAIVYVDYVGEALPASGFVVDEAKVSEAKLVYMPRDRNFARNEFYDLKYVFRGTALVGDREIGFTAVVDAKR